MTTSNHACEIGKGERFEFGKNWLAFLGSVNEEIVSRSVEALRAMLEMDSLKGKRFLDAGCGSGLSSLAARRLGAEVHSFDYDPQSVASARELKHRYMRGDGAWHVEEGSVLDPGYLAALGRFDVVYSWGVLHHTGDMYRAIENLLPLVAPGGLLFISLYNDQGFISRCWKSVKRLYNRNVLGRAFVLGLFIPILAARHFAAGVMHGGNPLREFIDYKKYRGMSFYHDWIDWLGGYPFEVASADKIFIYFRDRGFRLNNLKLSRSGCNEYVFRKESGAA